MLKKWRRKPILIATQVFLLGFLFVNVSILTWYWGSWPLLLSSSFFLLGMQIFHSSPSLGVLTNVVWPSVLTLASNYSSLRGFIRVAWHAKPFVLPPFWQMFLLYFLFNLSFSVQYDMRGPAKKLPCLIGKSKPSFRNCEVYMFTYVTLPKKKNLLGMFYSTYICHVLFHSMQY